MSDIITMTPITCGTYNSRSTPHGCAFLDLYHHLFGYNTAPSFTTTMSSSVAAPPSVSIKLVIDPPSFAPGNSDQAPSISITVTSHASQPITIFTWPTIFNLELSQKRKNFTCLDLTSNTPLSLELIIGPKRPDYSRTKDGIDDERFWTLDPETPLTFKAAFKLARRQTEGRYVLKEGHRYQLDVQEGEVVRWWRYGRKDEVMAPPGKAASLGEPSGEPIVLALPAPVDFEVKQEALA